MELHLARLGENRGLDLGELFVDRRRALIGGGFGDHGDLQLAGRHVHVGNQQPEPLEAEVVEHALQLVGRAGQQNHQPPLAFVAGLDPLAGRGAAAVGQQLGPGNAVGLLDVVLRDTHTKAGGPGIHGGHRLVIAAEFDAQGLGHALAREVVLGGAQTAGKQHDLSPGERDAAGLQQMLGAVAHDGLEDDFHPELVEPPGQEQGIGVLAEGRQEFGADGYDLSVHGYQCKPNGAEARTTRQNNSKLGRGGCTSGAAHSPLLWQRW